MAEAEYVAGVDVGTTKICTLIAQTAPNGQLDILGIGLHPSKGLKQGVVVDRAEAVESIRQSVARAEEMADLPIAGAYVGVTGSHIRSRNVTGRVRVDPRGEVTAADIEKVVQGARDNVSVAPDRQIIHTLVRDFSIDGQAGVKRPLGMHGARLDADVHIVTGMAGAIRNVRDVVEEAGVTVQKQVLEPVATSLAVLSADECQLGAVLIDIGGGTTDVAVFVAGAIAHSAAIPIAGDYITQDIAKLLRISYDQAEEVKKKFGTAFADMVSEEESVLVNEIGTGEQAQAPRRLIAEIIEARLEEIFLLTVENLRRVGMYDTISGGVVLTGGGSQLPGTMEMTSQIMDNIPVRIGTARGVGRMANRVASPIFATGVGLAMHAAEEAAYAGPVAAPAQLAWLTPIKEWWSQHIEPRIAAYLPRR